MVIYLILSQVTNKSRNLPMALLKMLHWVLDSKHWQYVSDNYSATSIYLYLEKHINIEKKTLKIYDLNQTALSLMWGTRTL